MDNIIERFVYNYKQINFVYRLNLEYNVNINFKNYAFGNIFVKDLIPKDIEYLLLLESPHKNEIEKKYPLAGPSGLNVSKKLLDDEISMGEIINRKISNKESFAYGIVNICNIPLQNIPGKTNYDTSIAEALKSIRTNPLLNSLNITKKYKEDLQKIIFKEFSSKLDIILRFYPTVRVICCGDTAVKFYNHYFFMKNNVKYANHPSGTGWNELNVSYLIND